MKEAQGKERLLVGQAPLPKWEAEVGVQREEPQTLKQIRTVPFLKPLSMQNKTLSLQIDKAKTDKEVLLIFDKKI